MIMGWLLLADGRHPKDLKNVIAEAMRWRQRVGAKRAHNHRRNWYPALAGILLAEYGKFYPNRKLRAALQDIVDHFVGVQEVTGGWFKWHEGAFKDRLDYAVKDLGMLDAIIFGFLCTARTQGVQVPAKTFKGVETCIHKILSARGISYGTGSRGGDRTGARGAFALNGLYYMRDRKHEIARVYENLLPKQIPNMDKGHHVGGLHCLGVTLGCRLLGTKVYKKLTDRWLDSLIDRQKPDGGIYVGDDEDAGGEKKLLGEDDASTAAAALLILLQDPSRLVPGKRPQVNWLALNLEAPAEKKFKCVVQWAARGRLGEILNLVQRSLASKYAEAPEKGEAAAIQRAVRTHALARLDEAEASLKEGDVLHALEIAEPLSETLPRHEIGLQARRMLERIRRDKQIKLELQAQMELEKAWQTACRKGLRKARPAFRRIVERFPDTVAAKKAREVVD